MKWIFVTLMLNALPVFAGNSFGNGGDAVVCRTPNGEIESAQLLDFYEYEVMDGGHIDLGPDYLSEYEKVENVLQQMRRLNPTRAHLYSQGLKNFAAEAKFVDSKLEDVNDSGDTILPRNCTIEQLAIQLACTPGAISNPHECYTRVDENYYNWDIVYYRYQIQRAIWNKLDTNSKAGLILHELLYREASNILRHENSVFVRQINALLSSGKWDQWNQNDYNQVFLRNRFGSVDMDVWANQQKSTYFVTHYWSWGVDHENKVQYHSNSTLKSASPQYSHNIEIIPLWIDTKMYKIYSTVSRDVNYMNEYEFDENGQLMGLEVVKNTDPYPLILNGRTYLVDKFSRSKGDWDFKNSTTFHKKGLELMPFMKKTVKFGKKNESSYFLVNESGKLITGTLAEPFQFVDSSFELNAEPGSFVVTDIRNHRLTTLHLATGWMANPDDFIHVKLKSATIQINNENKVLNASITLDHPKSSVEGTIVIPGLDRLAFKNNIYRTFDQLSRRTRLEIGALTSPLKCIYQEKIYSVQNNIELSFGTLMNEPVRIHAASELEAVLEKNDFCTLMMEPR